MKPTEILTTLVKAIGPINTFIIKNGYAAYSELRLKCHNEYDYVGSRIIPKNCIEYVVNTSLAMVKITDSSKWTGIGKYLAEEAAQIAHNENRIECECVGKLDDKAAAKVLSGIISNTELKSKLSVAMVEEIEKIKANQPDPRAPDTLGWRVWHWDPVAKRLKSPSQQTIWETPELRVTNWSTIDAVRGHAGIHAARVPYDWKRASLEGTELAGFIFEHNFAGPVIIVTGIVERFGRYVLGTEGWRSEWVIIRKLKAQTTHIGLLLEQAYPDVEIHYADR